MTKENKGIILVADDDPSLIKTTEMLIDMGFPGFKIEPFEDGTSLEERLNQDVSDVRLVITDNTMPGPNGSEIIKSYAGRLEQIPFILHYSPMEIPPGAIGEEAVRNGAFGYLIKTGEIDPFLDLVGRALDSSG